MQANGAWSGSDHGDDDMENEMANLCFMAHDDVCFMAFEDEHESSNEVDEIISYDELHDAFECLHGDFEKLSIKYKNSRKLTMSLEDKIVELQRTNDLLTKELKDARNSLLCIENVNHQKLTKENDRLNKELDDYKNIAYKFTQGKENLDMMLGCQRQSLSKHGLGFSHFTFKNSGKTKFVKQGTTILDDTCTFCGKSGHIAFRCSMRINRHIGEKMMWVPKGTNVTNVAKTNKSGPKKIWVPISKA